VSEMGYGLICWGDLFLEDVSKKTPNSPTKFQITTKKMLGFQSKSRLRRVYFQVPAVSFRGTRVAGGIQNPNFLQDGPS